MVIGTASSSSKLSEIKKDLQDAFIALTCDISEKKNIETTSQQIRFFLNAGIAGEAVIKNPNQFDLKIHERIMQVNHFCVLAWVEFWEKPYGANFIAMSSVNAILAPPKGSAYSASKAAIAKAFENLSLTYFGTNLRFSVVSPGPVDTVGLKGNWPFTWKPEKMGKCMVDFALSNKSSCEPFFFYKIVTRLLRALPAKYTMKILGKL